MLDFAVRMAKKAGKIHLKYFRKLKSVKYKGYVTNLVTNADLEAEKMIKAMINKKYPSHGILAEESLGENIKNEYRWIIDPLDGTVNYAHGFPLFCVSIALQRKGKTIVGVVYSALLDELFTAEAGRGAFLNGKRIKVSPVKELEKAFLATGFPYTLHQNPGNQYEWFNRFCRRAQAVRRGGSASLDLCYVACGIFDGFWEKELKPWDTAAAELIVVEAGGRVSDYSGRKFDNFGDEISASNGKIHAAMLAILKR
ncbi:MAG: inositol monophosphatase family protein [Candidatus Firestonebacteria bacterium]